MTKTEAKLRAAANAAEGIAAAKARRTPETAKIAALAERVILDRLARTNIVGTTSKGRIAVEFVGEPTAAELEMAGLLR